MELNTANRPMENEEIEIDLLQLWNAVRHRIWLVLLAGFVVADIAFAITKFLITPMYSSSATFVEASSISIYSFISSKYFFSSNSLRRHLLQMRLLPETFWSIY